MKELAQMSWVEVMGYVASTLVFCSFYMKTMIPLRVAGILSNVAFMTYAVGRRVFSSGRATPPRRCTSC